MGSASPSLIGFPWASAERIPPLLDSCARGVSRIEVRDRPEFLPQRALLVIELRGQVDG